MAMAWTEEQRQVIELRDKNILVSAAAGSGKTAVLVERIIARLTRDDPPADVDRLLVVTYTEAAAAEMRERIAAAIERAMEEQPENLHLKRQSSLIHSARITTIHSFCLSVIREYFHTIDLDPGFRVGEEGELTLLRQDVMKEMLEEHYEEARPEFLQFVETFASGREDTRLEELILRLYEFAGSYPEPEKWLDGCAEAYEEDLDGEPLYLERVMEYVRNCLADVRADMERARAICREADGPHMYEKTIDGDAALVGPLFALFLKRNGKGKKHGEEEKENVEREPENAERREGNVEGEAGNAGRKAENREREARDAEKEEGNLGREAGNAEKEAENAERETENAEGETENAKRGAENIEQRNAQGSGSRLHAGRYREAYAVWEGMDKWPRLASNRDKEVDVGKAAQVKAMREAWKKQVSGLRDAYFFQTPQEMAEDLRLCRPVMRTLVELVKEFQQRFAQRKAEKNLIDFRDMEQFALQILTRVEGDERVPSETAREYQEQFLEVMVDEYQDSNLIQEAILTSVSRVSRGEYNLFMVGDVKQSIYRFRLSRPELFMEKFDRYSTEEGDLRRIDLHRNFRSRREVLDAANAVFRQIMTRKLGNVAYDNRAALYPGADYPEGQENVAEILIVDPKMELEGDLPGKQILAEKGAAVAAEPGTVPAAGREAAATKEPETAQKIDNRELEARAVAERIHLLMEEQQIWDAGAGAYRPVRYGDIVILTRSLAGWTDVFSQVLNREGIPTLAVSREGYFETLEIGWLLDYLRVLDNVLQDLPLAAVLRSPFGGCTNEELALIREAFPELPFCEAALAAAGYGRKEENRKTEAEPSEEELPEVCSEKEETAEERLRSAARQPRREEILPVILVEKLRNIFDGIYRFRERLPYTPIHELLWQILKETGYRNYVAAMPGGEQRLANLEMLASRAKAFEAASYKGLFHFVRYVEQLKKYNVDYGEAGLYDDQAEAVRLMSIHKSKGLEFPVVIVAGMGKQFNRQDIRASVVIHPDLGLGLDAVDVARRTKSPTLIKKAIQNETDLENLGEELRVLYVAMTRAKEKLILVGTLSDAEKKLDAYEAEEPEAGETAWKMEKEESAPLSFTRLAGASTYFDWVLPAICRNADPSLWRLHVWGPEQIVSREVGREMAAHMEKDRYLRAILDREHPAALQDEAFARRLEEQFSYQYPFAGEGRYKLKYTVSELKKRASLAADEEAGELLVEEEDVIPLVPDFLKEEEELTGASRGTAYHKLLELLDLTREYDRESLAEAVESFRRDGLLGDDMAACVRIPDLLRFLHTDSGRRMARAARAGRLYREQPFVFGVDAKEFYSKADAGELVLIQGIIDVYFEEEDGLVVLDYKTDRIRSGQELAEKYQEQLHLYGRALEQLTGKKVKDKVIYSFTLGEEIRVDQKADGFGRE